jgi:hypothetical protein
MSSETSAGTPLLDLSIQGGVAAADLAEEFRSGDATPASLNVRLAQYSTRARGEPDLQEVHGREDGDGQPLAFAVT